MEYSIKKMENDLFRIQEQIEKSCVIYHEVVGLVRGGVIPATLLSHRLGLPVSLINWSFRDHKRVDHHALDNIMYNIYRGRRYLIVDDMIDSGETLFKFYSALNNLTETYEVKSLFEKHKPHLAVLISNLYPQHIIRPTYYGRSINRNIDNTFINFWWEEK